MIVIDASVAVKWFKPEVGSEAALSLIVDTSEPMIAPDVFAIEVISAFVRVVNVGRAARPQMNANAEQFVAMLEAGRVILRPTTPTLLVRATSRAMDIGHPLKDCVYLALAEAESCALLTADRRFFEKASSVSSAVRLLAA